MTAKRRREDITAPATAISLARRRCRLALAGGAAGVRPVANYSLFLSSCSVPACWEHVSGRLWRCDILSLLGAAPLCRAALPGRCGAAAATTHIFC